MASEPVPDYSGADIVPLREGLTGPPPFAPLNIRGGGGTSGGMDDGRLDRLEGRVEKLADRFGGVEVQLATLTERVSHLATREEVGTMIGTSLEKAGSRVQRNVAIFGALIGIAVAASNYLLG